MSKWIFIEDFALERDFDQAINLDFVVNIALRLEDSQIVIFFSENHIGPHVLEFETKELCQSAYDNLKTMLKAEK